ncbi:hypothetical protein WA026_005062 [Henosepilachna vigintioctopunctata]|uniref:Uncharacterized protein n=1 Tax=Henosepilachna vigintioctopunctata TaxID=420089 RepID=A0AAW1UMU4_9CUCU
MILKDTKRHVSTDPRNIQVYEQYGGSNSIPERVFCLTAFGLLVSILVPIEYFRGPNDSEQKINNLDGSGLSVQDWKQTAANLLESQR